MDLSTCIVLACGLCSPVHNLQQSTSCQIPKVYLSLWLRATEVKCTPRSCPGAATAPQPIVGAIHTPNDPCVLAVLQARRVRLLSCSPPAVPPSHLYEGCQALRCEAETASGARLVVVLGGPMTVLGQQALVEHALRQTLVSRWC